MIQYWPTLPDQELCNEAMSRVNSYFEWLLFTNRIRRWRLAYDTYYGKRGQHNSSFITAGGDKGELSFLMSNEYRNLVQHLLNLATKQNPSLEFVATNTDSQSKSQTFLAKGIVNYYRRDGKIDDNTRLATEISLLMDLGWVFNEWDLTLGDDVRPDLATGEMIKTGDIFTRAKTPLEVVTDFTKTAGNQDLWRIVIDKKNKFDLAAQYPEKANEILAIQPDTVREAMVNFGEPKEFDGMQPSEINVYTLYHAKSPAVPKGKIFQFLSSSVYLGSSMPLPYQKIPGNRICPSEMILSSMGYSNTNDLLGLQDAIDGLISSAVTNMSNLGINNVWVKPGADFDFEQLASGMNLIESEEKPEVLTLNRLPPEWFNLANFLVQRMEAISGINSVARGNTQGKDFSGAAMALLQSMAIEFNSGLQRAVNKLIEDNGNDIIGLTQDFAKEPRIKKITGIKNRYQIKRYSAKDLSKIRGVYCRQGNKASETTAWAWEMAQLGTKIGAIKTMRGIQEVLDTGTLDSVLEDERNDRLCIDQENDLLVNGEVPAVSFIHRHPEHLDGHRAVIADVESLQDAELVLRVKEHIESHLREWQNSPPEILLAFGIPPFPAMGPPGIPPGPGMPPPPQGDLPNGPMPPPKDLKEPNEANFPQNPLTQKKWNPETGGL
jgi:hypothetical protein